MIAEPEDAAARGDVPAERFALMGVHPLSVRIQLVTRRRPGQRTRRAAGRGPKWSTPGLISSGSGVFVDCKRLSTRAPGGVIGAVARTSPQRGHIAGS